MFERHFVGTLARPPQAPEDCLQGRAFLISRSVLGPAPQRWRAGGGKQKQKTAGGAGGPGFKLGNPPLPALGQVVGDTLGSGPDVATWVRAGLVMCRHVLTDVDFCGSAYLLISHRNALENAYSRAHKPENRLKTFCFCFLRRGPGPSEVAGGLTLTERSKTLRPGRSCRPSTRLRAR